MFFRSNRDSVDSVFCDFYSEFHATHPEDFFRVYGLKWPDDFEDSERIGISKIQVISDFKSGLCLFNHAGTLYPFTERKLLERSLKIKMNVVTEKLGKYPPFDADNVYSLETGFNFGNVEFMTFDLSKRKQTSIENYRRVLYKFPLFEILRKVVDLKEMEYKEGLTFESIEKLEKDKILNYNELKEWKFIERDITPSKDQYREKVEFVLQNYSFSSNDDKVYVWLKFEFFHT
jgi:hypothetical protein